ncbi:MAG: M24 family metallopeptidase [Actinomycetota bacterium]|nr:M24 family metallopeptidase [Actinomycetota bacterium]
MRASEQALDAALKVVRAGVALNEIGAAVQRLVHARGFSVCDGPMGHGIGRRIHEAPDVPNVFDPALSRPLSDGLVITIEPLVAAGGPAVRMSRDGWTVRTADSSPASAQRAYDRRPRSRTAHPDRLTRGRGALRHRPAGRPQC